MWTLVQGSVGGESASMFGDGIKMVANGNSQYPDKFRWYSLRSCWSLYLYRRQDMHLSQVSKSARCKASFYSHSSLPWLLTSSLYSTLSTPMVYSPGLKLPHLQRCVFGKLDPKSASTWHSWDHLAQVLCYPAIRVHAGATSNAFGLLTSTPSCLQQISGMQIRGW